MRGMHMKALADVKCCIWKRTSSRLAISRANAAHRALIVVGLAILADIGPESVVRVGSCNVLQSPLTYKLKRLIVRSAMVDPASVQQR